MASSIIGALRAVLGLDTAQFESGADRAKVKAGGLKSALMSTAASLAPLASGAALATLAVNGFAVGMRLAAEAAKYADDIAAQSYKLGVSAEYLQAFNFAAGESDVEVTKAVDALSGLTAAIGALQTRVGDGKIRKAMEALGITQEQIKSFKSVEDALPVIADKIAALGTVTEQLQFAKKFGIEALLPMLKQGSVGIQEMMGKAQDLGLVLDGGVVDRLAEMSRQMEIADDRSKMAGISFGASFTPALVTMKNAAADLVNWLGRVIDRFNKVENRSLQTLGEQRGKLFRQLHEAEQLSALPGMKTFANFLKGKIAENDAAMGAIRRAQQENALDLAPTNTGGGSGGGGGESNSPKSKSAGAEKDGESWESLFYQSQSHRAELQAREFERQFTKSIINPASLQEPISTMVSEGILDGMEASKKAFSDQIYSATRGGLEALRYGGLKGLGNWLAGIFAQSLDDKIAGGVASLFSKGSGLSKSGGIMSALKSFIGFDTGGGFQVGGFGGTDSQIRALRLTPGEQVSVTRGNDLGGRVNQTFHVNAQGAILAAGLVAELQQLGTAQAVVAAHGGAAMAEQAATTSNRYRIARS